MKRELHEEDAVNYLKSDLGHINSGETVRVELDGNEANVMLVDAHNFANYRAGRSYRYYGGATRRPVNLLEVPRSGHWYVVVDLGGYRGHVKASCSVL